MEKSAIYLKKLGINTYKEAVIYMREDSYICRSEGFELQSRVKVRLNGKSIIATLNTIDSDLLRSNEVSLSKYAWDLLSANEGEKVTISHAMPVESLRFVRSKIYGNELSQNEMSQIIQDVAAGKYSDINISSFLTACAGGRMNENEIIYLTKAMINVGERLDWESDIVVDKHCVGGLPGNRTTPIIVSIVAAFGLIMPKTSSRAITSPAGTADTMEVLAPVELDITSMKDVITKENGCIAWGGAVSLSPADDILIRVEKALDLDSDGQLIASILSKKIAAGSTHILIDIPVGITAKVRSVKAAQTLKDHLESIGKNLGVVVKTVFTDGSQPVGHGIGPTLEARDIVSVLKCDMDAPQDLRDRAIMLAGKIIEFSDKVKEGEGKIIASNILDSGQAWQKFQAICQAQGGMKQIPKAEFTYPYKSNKNGIVSSIDNRRIALIAKLAGAPNEKTAGVDLHVHVDDMIAKDQSLFTIHANSIGELNYVLDYLNENGNEIITIKG